MDAIVLEFKQSSASEFSPVVTLDAPDNQHKHTFPTKHQHNQQLTPPRQSVSHSVVL